MAENLETAAEEAVSAGQGESVDAQTETLNAEVSAGAGQPGAADGQSKEPQTRAENAAFKRMRQRMEALERENAAFRAERQGEVEDARGVWAAYAQKHVCCHFFVPSAEFGNILFDILRKI